MGTFVQSKTKNDINNVNSIALTWSSNTTTGNFILVCVFYGFGSSTNISSVTDSQGNTYARIGGSANQGLGMEMWYAKNITGGTTPTVTINQTTARNMIAIIREYSGLSASNPIDVSNFGNSTNSTTPVSGNITTNFAAESIVGFTNIERSPVVWTAGSGFGNLVSIGDDGAGVSLATEDKTVSSTGTYTAGFTSDTAGPWEAAVVGLVDASQPTTTSTSISTSSTSTSSTSTSVSTSSTSASTSSTSISQSTSTSTSTTTIGPSDIPVGGNIRQIRGPHNSSGGSNAPTSGGMPIQR